MSKDNFDLPQYQSPDEELLDGLQVGGLRGRETKEGDGNGKKPGPFPDKRLKQEKLSTYITQKSISRKGASLKKHLGHKELLKLKDKDVKPVEDVGGEFGEHQEEEIEVDRDCPFQPVLVHLAEMIFIRI